MHTKTALVVLSALVSAAAIGCGSGGGSPAIDGPTGTQRASLHRAKSCGDLLGDLKADAIYKLNHALDRQIEIVRACQAKYGDTRCAYGAYVGGGDFGGMARGEATANDAAAPAAPAPSAGASSSSGGTGGSKSAESAGSYSETNTQVKGVDEADIVKNDGKNLYVIHGRAFKLLNAWPANELREVSTLDIEGNPTEMFVADGKVVVYSQVNGASIFAAAGVTPKEQYQEYGYGGIGVATDVARGGAMPYPGPGGQTGPYVPLSKVTVLQLDGTTPRVTREVYFEGNYLDSRRVGSHVRTVFQGYQYGPKLKYSVYDLYPQTAPAKDAMNPNPNPVDYSPKSGSEAIKQIEELRQANVAIINASQLGDWLPYTFVRNGAQISAQTVACEDFYVPSIGSTQSGLTEVSSLDLADPAATPKDTAILGRADTVYGSADTLYLAANAWVEPPFQWNDNLDSAVSSDGSAGSTPPSVGGTEPAPAPSPTPGGKVGAIQTRSLRPQTTPLPPNEVIAWSSNNTHLHKFEFKTDPKFPNYVASGTVHGSVKNQFSLDDKDGYLRIATTESRNYVTRAGKYVQPDFPTTQNTNFVPVRPNSVNHLFVLGQNGPWLDTVGDVGELALNEQIYSVRFVESRGYVVTFRQVDPLFVVDLANPQKPNLLAALKIPGFSEYMHPLGNNHLLTIGRDASDTGRARGLQLQIFDVTNGSNPLVKHKFTYTGDEYGSSEAQYDHKAFTYFAEKGLLAFPYYSYNVNSVNGGMRSSLELFRVDLGAGFTKIGSIDHTSLLQQHPNGYCGGYYGPSVRRGVFLENFVYSISYGGVVVRDANNLAAQGPQLALPSPVVNDGYGPVCAY